MQRGQRCFCFLLDGVSTLPLQAETISISCFSIRNCVQTTIGEVILMVEVKLMANIGGHEPKHHSIPMADDAKIAADEGQLTDER